MEILSDIVYKILPNRIKIIDSYQITDRSRMRKIIYAIQHNHPEVRFDRDHDNLIHEWVAHNRLYRWNIKRNRTKDVDLCFNESWLNKIIWFIIGS